VSGYATKSSGESGLIATNEFIPHANDFVKKARIAEVQHMR
jgi:hypothetical protein